VVSDVDAEKEEGTTKPNDNETNDRQEVLSEDVDNHSQHTVINLEDTTTENQQEIESENDEMNTDRMLTIDELTLGLNGENITDQMQEAIAVEDVGDTNNQPSRTKNERGVKNERGAKTTKEQNQQPTEHANEMKEQGEPILEYAEEPILPLAEACAPLADILHDLSFYVKMALDETPKEPPDGLTIDESAAIRLYTIEWTGGHRSLYSMLNYTLKTMGREHLRPYFKYMKLLVTALVKLPCVPPCTVWRGVTKDLSAEFQPGTAVTWWAFSSCTTELSVLENNMYLGDSGSRTLFSVEVINGRTVRAHSHFVTEDELLLLPGTYMVVQSLFSPAPQLHIFHLRQEIPEEVLLAPPYEGIFRTFSFTCFKSKYFYT
jgi:hypothetical protein